MNLLAFFLAAPAWAAKGGEHHDADISGIIFPLLNFLIYAGLIVYFGFPAMRRFLKQRREQVFILIRQAAARKQQGMALLQDYRSRLSRLDQESQAIQAQLRSEGEREKKRLLSEAEALAAKIKSDALLLAEQEFKVAKQQVLEELVETATALAVNLARRHVSPADHGRLVEEFIHGVGRSR